MPELGLLPMRVRAFVAFAVSYMRKELGSKVAHLSRAGGRSHSAHKGHARALKQFSFASSFRFGGRVCSFPT
jgi:hypothetical protein